MTEYSANPGDVMLPAEHAVGNALRVLPVRSTQTATATLAVFKQVPLSGLREGARREIRVESFNAFKHPQHGSPNSTVRAATFGVVTNQRNSARQVPVGAKLYWGEDTLAGAIVLCGLGHPEPPRGWPTPRADCGGTHH